MFVPIKNAKNISRNVARMHARDVEARKGIDNRKKNRKRTTRTACGLENK